MIKTCFLIWKSTPWVGTPESLFKTSWSQQGCRQNLRKIWSIGFCFLALTAMPSSLIQADLPSEKALSQIDESRGVIAVLGLPRNSPKFVNEMALAKEFIVYFQSDKHQDVEAVRKAADEAGILGRSVFAEYGALNSVHLTHNLADAVFVDEASTARVTDEEILRVLRPQAKALIGDRQLIKPIPEGMDDWSHPYHGADNNPQSSDRYVRGEFETQFIADPKFSPMPEQTVIAGGRIFKAMGHIAHKSNQNAMLNTMLCINAYNGTILWQRPLSEGFMIHRNTMIAADDALYMGDHESCKVIDAKTGELRRSIIVPPDLTDGPVWKWMAMKGDVLFALVGNPEMKVETIRSDRPGLGHWPWGMWQGHDYKDPRTAFGYGRTLIAVDRHSGKVLWHYRDEEFLDARALCMKNDKIFCYCPEKFLACIDATNGKLHWKNSDENLLAAIGPNEKAQHYITGYATTCYMKCSDDSIFFAGPQRKKMVVASATDGSLQWTNDVGNLQLVLRENAIYAAGPEKTYGMQLDYKSGAMLASLPARRACTRATGCVDSIFFRATGGTVRLMTDNNQAQHIAPMRPPCQDGVLISNGHLYWGPWMCGCQLSLYGNIGLRPIGEKSRGQQSIADVERDSLTVHPNATHALPLPIQPHDWVTFRGSNNRSDISQAALAAKVTPSWTSNLVSGELPTAPVAAGGFVFVADRAGVVHAFSADGKPKWKAYTGGSIFYPPTVANDRLYVGSADGRVYAFEATTGRPLWTFRVAPEDSKIAMYGKLVSRWPVAGGVILENGKLYAAAGITHYDGTYVVALDAISGNLVARNDSSGKLSDVVNSGISMQGELSVVDGELRFPGGGIYEIARYNLDTLECLNEVRHQLSSEYRTAFYPWYPSYDKFVSMEHPMPNGNILSHDASYDGSAFGNLSLETPRPLGTQNKLKKDLAGEFLRRRGKVPPETKVWIDQENRRFTSFAICNQTLLATGHTENAPDKPFLVAVDLVDGSDLWKHPLPAEVVKGGTAVNASGQIFLTLENGQLMCFSGPAVP
jgi:outer membrane protein assembly factor BamB